MTNHFIFRFASGLFLSLLFTAGLAVAQNPVGEITYMEGTVRIQNNGAWAPAQMKMKVAIGQNIETGSDGSVEIRWTNSSKTVLEGSRRQAIKELFENSGKNVKSGSEGFFTSFKTLFKNKGADKQQEGGIRRNEVEVKAQPGRNDVYWKSDEEASFETGSNFYEAQDYPKAARTFRLFLEQRPKDPRAHLAMFALGHCYLEMNNLPEAKVVFSQFADKFPEDELVEQSKQLLAKF